jgi:hypothetical protein
MEVPDGCIVVVVQKNQPVALYMPNGRKISFGVVQFEDAERFSANDLSVISRILADFVLTALIVIDYKGNISGVISPDDLKDLEKTILSEAFTEGRHLDLKLKSNPSDVILPEVRTTRIWACKKHPEAPTFFLHQIGQPPFCPLCDDEKLLSSRRLFKTKKFWFFRR